MCFSLVIICMPPPKCPSVEGLVKSLEVVRNCQKWEKVEAMLGISLYSYPYLN
jgi:hypothetical protein